MEDTIIIYNLKSIIIILHCIYRIFIQELVFENDDL